MTLWCSAGASPFGSPASLQGASSSASLLIVQDIMATVQLRNAPAASGPSTASASGRQSEGLQPPQMGKDPAEHSAKGIAGALKPPAVSPSSRQEPQGSRKLIKAGLELDGLRAVFNAEAVFAACQIAADATSLQAALAPAANAGGTQEGAVSRVSGSSSSPRRDAKAPEQQQQAARAAPPQKKAGFRGKSSRFQVELIARLSDLQGEARLSEAVCWGVRMRVVSAALAPRCVVAEGISLTLNSAQLISLGVAVVTVSLPGVLEAPPPERCPWAMFPRAEGAEDLGRALTGAILPPSARAQLEPERAPPDFDESQLESASLMNSIVTDMDGDGELQSYQFMSPQSLCYALPCMPGS